MAPSLTGWPSDYPPRSRLDAPWVQNLCVARKTPANRLLASRAQEKPRPVHLFQLSACTQGMAALTMTIPSPMTRSVPARARLEEALGRCAAGDPAALRFIYDAEAPRMLGVAMRILRRRSLAEEAVHDTYLQVWQHASSFDAAKGNARTWLYAILRNRALNILRGEARTELTEDFEPMGLTSEDESPETIVLRLSDTGALKRCLELLDPVQRQAILLAYVRGLSHGELAGRFGVPLGTMKSWMRRSLAALRECMP
jgi:RNA polymerase sigma factor (sigma-70 family)